MKQQGVRYFQTVKQKEWDVITGYPQRFTQSNPVRNIAIFS